MRDVTGVIEEISAQDRIATASGPEVYFESGRWALRRIQLTMLAAQRETFSSILDLGSGFGRVLRMLKAAFPEASLTACDIEPAAVDFCARTFGATPAYGKEDPRELDLSQRFDLIWCCSLLTHFEEGKWPQFLSFFEDRLEKGGLVVFTTHGRFVASVLRLRASGTEASGTEPAAVHKNLMGISEEGALTLLESYEDRGFGYAAHGRGLSHGISLSDPSWVCTQIETHAPGLDLLTYTAGGWGRHRGGEAAPLATAAQDVVACVRIEDRS